MDVAVTMIDLPSPVLAAASDGTTVWCAGSDGVRAYTASGTPLHAAPGTRRPPHPTTPGERYASRTADRGNELRAVAGRGDMPHTAGSGDTPHTVDRGDVPRTAGRGDAPRATDRAGAARAADRGEGPHVAGRGDVSRLADRGTASRASVGGDAARAMSGGDAGRAANGGDAGRAEGGADTGRAANGGDTGHVVEGGVLVLRSLAAVPGTVSAGTAGVPGTLAETVMVPRTFAGAPPVDSRPSGSLAGTVAGIAGDRVYWLDPEGFPLASAHFEGRVLAGGGEIWAVGTDRACRLAAPGRLGELVELPGLDRCAVEGERLWWTSKRDTLLRGGPKEVDLGERERGGMIVCAGSLWVSVADGLLRVSAWSGEPRRLVPAPEGPVPFLVCANGIVAGAGHDLFALAPAAGAPLRVIPLGLQSPPALMIAAGKHVWVFPADRPQALIVPV
ncbi:hypothetical protein [Nonomuraea zeae]|uniref:Uncharacterized protein n=1 Tax=Nonomuraea zeae TaxID=1642303 RepID=A0A5S4F2D1_9ACTN|nr:hypothetical protein [Nonomuraea zeae]TMR10145.1 hypothetical protein ETD85_60760 [Nonomuraea zeae]